MSVSEILARSPKHERVKRTKHGVFAIGHIDSMARAFNLAYRKSEPVVYTLKERIFDIPENRIITEAILRALPLLNPKYFITFQPIANRWCKRFPTSNQLNNDLQIIEQRFASGKYGGLRDYYKKALMLALLILSSNGFGFNTAATILGDAVLLNTASVFEEYIRNIIKRSYYNTDYTVSKGEYKTQSLYTNGSYSLHPDVIIDKKGEVILICDAKYKQPDSSDHYQMYVYLLTYGIKSGVLLAPLFEGDDIIIQEFSTFDRTVIREVYLPMTNLKLTEDFLGDIISKFRMKT